MCEESPRMDRTCVWEPRCYQWRDAGSFRSATRLFQLLRACRERSLPSPGRAMACPAEHPSLDGVNALSFGARGTSEDSCSALLELASDASADQSGGAQ